MRVPYLIGEILPPEPVVGEVDERNASPFLRAIMQSIGGPPHGGRVGEPTVTVGDLRQAGETTRQPVFLGPTPGSSAPADNLLRVEWVDLHSGALVDSPEPNRVRIPL